MVCCCQYCKAELDHVHGGKHKHAKHNCFDKKRLQSETEPGDKEKVMRT